MAEPDVQTDECIVSGVEAHSRAHRRLQIPKVELVMMLEHFARVGEDSHIHSAEDFPAPLRVHYQAVVTIKAKRPVAAKIVISAEHTLQIKRYGLPIGDKRMVGTGT